MAKETTTDNEIVRTVKLEQEWLTGGQGVEGFSTTRLPEVHFVGAKLCQVVEPIRVGDSDEEPH
jgi:hypothetical protein